MMTASLCLALLALGLAVATATAGSSAATLAPPAGWSVSGRAVAADTVRVIVAVAQDNVEFLERTLTTVSDPDSPRYGQYIPLDTLATLVHGREDAIDAVRAALAQATTARCETTMDKAWFDCNLSAEDAEAMFGADFHRFEHIASGVSVVKTLSTAIPAAMDGHVDFITGHNTFPRPGRPVTVTAARGNTTADGRPLAAVTPA